MIVEVTCPSCGVVLTARACQRGVGAPSDDERAFLEQIVVAAHRQMGGCVPPVPASIDWRCITVKQPWCKALWLGAKSVENRGRGFPANHRGWVGLHAGKAWSVRGARDPRILALFPDVPRQDEAAPRFGGQLELARPERIVAGGRVFLHSEYFTFGSIEAVGELEDVHPAHPGCCESGWAEQSYEDAGGRRRTEVVHLVFGRVVELDRPLWGVRGALGLWRPTPDDAEELTEQLTASLGRQRPYAR